MALNRGASITRTIPMERYQREEGNAISPARIPRRRVARQRKGQEKELPGIIFPFLRLSFAQNREIPISRSRMMHPPGPGGPGVAPVNKGKDA